MVERVRPIDEADRQSGFACLRGHWLGHTRIELKRLQAARAGRWR
jgi:hypothetical protein